MSERTDFLTRLRGLFGTCGRLHFLQRLREKFAAPADTPEVQETPRVLPQATAYRAIDINGTDAWHSHVERLKGIFALEDCLHQADMLAEKEMSGDFAASVRSMQKTLREIPPYVEKNFKEPLEIDEDTSEDVAAATGKFVKKHIFSLLRACHQSRVYRRGEQQVFYRAFAEHLAEYLASVCVYPKDIAPGSNLSDYSDWFASMIPKETGDADLVNQIDEIDCPPQFVCYRDADRIIEELKIPGSCIYYAAAKKK